MKINEAEGGLTQGILSGLKDLTRRDPFKNPNEKGYSAIGNWLRRKKSGLSKEDQMAYDNFVSKFVRKGMNAIQTAIDTGIVDPSSNSMTAPQTPPVATAATLGLTPGGQVLKQPTQATQQSTPHPTSTAQPATTQSQAPVSTTTQTPAVKPRVRINPQTGQMQAAPDQTKATNKSKTKQIKFTVMGDTYIKKPDGWYVGKKRINPETQDYIEKLYNQSLSETVEYFAMKMLLESKITEQQKMTISRYAKTYFVDPYLRGISFPPEAQAEINQILQNLPNVVQDKNQLASELKKIADIAWAIALAQNR